MIRPVFYTGIRAILAAAVAVCALTASAGASDTDARALVGRVRKALDATRTFSAEFSAVRRAEDGREQRMEGTIALKQPAFLRVEYGGQTIVIDGKNIWTYVPKNNQVQVSTFTGDDAGFPSPHTLFVRYAEERDAVIRGRETVGGVSCDVVDLIAKRPEDARVTVWVDVDRSVPVKTVEVSPLGDVTTTVMTAVRINEPMADTLFVFTPPDGVDIVDMRE